MTKNYRIHLSLLLILQVGCIDLSYQEVEPEANRKAFSKERQTALQDYLDNYIATIITDVPWSGNVETGEPGNTPSFVKEKVLQRVNYFRRLVGLPDNIVLSEEKNKKCQQAALMFRANETVSHSPPGTWLHYTDEGYEAASRSNIYYGKGGPRTVTGYIKEPGDNNYNVGHRRWLLYPELVEIGTGDTPNTNALWVIGDFGPTPENLPEFIAYPPADYIPSTLVFDRWSFSLKGADFSQAEVSMKNIDGSSIKVALEKLDERPIGDPTIVWVPKGLDLAAPNDQIFKVHIKNVEIEGEIKGFTYEVLAFNPNIF